MYSTIAFAGATGSSKPNVLHHRLRGRHRVVEAERDAGRPLHDLLDQRLAGLIGGKVRQPVLDDAKLDVRLPERPPQGRHVRDAHAGVVGRNGDRGAFEELPDLRNQFSFLIGRQ
jgi:hypothetical protein